MQAPRKGDMQAIGQEGDEDVRLKLVKGNAASSSLISNPLHRRKPVPTAKVDPGLRRESAEGTSSCIN
jgi:hypothetical protein